MERNFARAIVREFERLSTDNIGFEDFVDEIHKFLENYDITNSVTKMILQYPQIEEEHEVCSIQITQNSDRDYCNVNIWCTDGHHKQISILGLVQMIMGIPILHESTELIIRREYLDST